MGIRGQLFAASLLVLGGVFVGLDHYLALTIPTQIKDRLVYDLGREANLLASEAAALPSQTPERADPLADRLGAALSARATLIDATGRVLGDSSLSLGQLATLENHRDRPEFQAALLGGRGVASRTSATTGEELLYVAVPYPDGPSAGVARIALPLSTRSAS